MSFLDDLLAPRSNVWLDDAGLRITSREGGRYIPFAALRRNVNVAFRPFGVAFLRLTLLDGSDIAVRVSRDEALTLHADLTAHMQHRDDAGAVVGEAVSTALARGARPLLAWLGGVATWAASSGGYRTATLDHATASAALLDAHTPVELRAALAHAMLATADETELAAVARAFVLRALPPLVVVAARLGRGGAALVPDAMCEDALAFLPADADEARRAMAAPLTHEDEAHVHAIMERVKLDALAEAQARRAHDPHHAKPKRHAAPALGGYAGQQGVTRFK